MMTVSVVKYHVILVLDYKYYGGICQSIHGTNYPGQYGLSLSTK